MATRSPTQYHAYWGVFPNDSDLPNVSGSPTQNGRLQAGDVAYATAEQSLYVCTDPTQGSAAWQETLNAASHKALRDLIHFIDDGPADGFPSGAFKQTFYSGALIVDEVWWADNSATQRIVDLSITYTGALPTTEVWRMYASDGVTVLVTLTDAITYSGALETERTRTWV